MEIPDLLVGPSEMRRSVFHENLESIQSNSFRVLFHGSAFHRGGGWTELFRDMTYSEKLKDPRWQRRRLEILNRDEFTCRDCGDKENTLHVHHCTRIGGKEPWEYIDGDLRTLCWKCHEEREAIEHDVKLEFARLLAMLTHEQISAVMPQIREAQENDGPVNGLVVVTADEFEYQSDSKWYMQACISPSLRGHYEAVTGSHPHWIDSPQEP